MNYVAVEESKILVLHRSDFMRVMAENAELVNEMRMFLNEPQQTDDVDNRIIANEDEDILFEFNYHEV